MRVLIGKTFGIGNSILSIPMIKAISAVADETHVLVGNTPDDFGAAQVFRMLELSAFKPKGFRILTTPPGLSERYDVAVMAIPFDGRWRNGTDFVADRVLDGRKRPGNVERLGFDMWEKHEVEYQMENAYELGYDGPIPSSRFMSYEVHDYDRVYLGIGFKRDVGGFGLSKHFGNDKFADLIAAIRDRRPSASFVSTGGIADFVQVGAPIMKRIADSKVYNCEAGSGLPYAFTVLGGCAAYIGNDTGMMHAAAAFGLPTAGMFLSNDLIRKNHPWGTKWLGMVLGDKVDDIADRFCSLVWGGR